MGCRQTLAVVQMITRTTAGARRCSAAVSVDIAITALECSHNAPTIHQTGRRILWVQSVAGGVERILVSQPAHLMGGPRLSTQSRILETRVQRISPRGDPVFDQHAKRAHDASGAACATAGEIFLVSIFRQLRAREIWPASGAFARHRASNQFAFFMTPNGAPRAATDQRRN
jgi:hypothetical protein